MVSGWALIRVLYNQGALLSGVRLPVPGLWWYLVAFVLVEGQQHNGHGDDDSQQDACIGHRLPQLGFGVSGLLMERGVHPARTGRHSVRL